MSEKIAQATAEALRVRILEWEDAYDRVYGALELRMDILECKQALADLAGSYYDVVLGEMAERAERAEADNAALRAALITWINADGTMAFADADEDLAELARALTADDHPGASLLAELALARALRAACHPLGSMAQLDKACAAYDAAVQARTA